MQVFTDPGCTSQPVEGETYSVLYVRLNRGFGFNDTTRYGNDDQTFANVVVFCPDDGGPDDPYTIYLYENFSCEDQSTPFLAGSVLACSAYSQVTLETPLIVDFIPD